jgi:hypothetical protein
VIRVDAVVLIRPLDVVGVVLEVHQGLVLVAPTSTYATCGARWWRRADLEAL